jgi:cytochrome b
MEENKQVKVWDLFVRLFHWTLVAAVATALVTAEEIRWVHTRAGYLVFSLVVLRIFWGFAGTRHARFSDFVYPPAEAVSYLKGLVSGRPKHYVGHNPAGGWMVLILLIVLLGVTLTGMMTYGDKGFGPFGGLRLLSTARADEDRHESEAEEEHDRMRREGQTREESPWQKVHETLVGILLFLIAVHVTGVIASSYVHRENLIKSMITGKKPSRG